MYIAPVSYQINNRTRNSINFGCKVSLYEGNNYVSKLSKIKDSRGKTLLRPRDVKKLIENELADVNQTIKNFRERVIAVLSNPEEIAQIEKFKDRAMGTWKSVRDPLDSTVKSNPTVFPELVQFVK